MLGNWNLSGVYTFASGRPFTVNSGSSLASAIDPYGAATAVPNVIGTPQIVGTVGCWFYASQNKACPASGLTDAFQLQSPGQFGNAGRNILIGPGLVNLDLSVFKNIRIPIGENRIKMQFRAELFNILNHANFAIPSNTDIFDSTGKPTGVAGLITSTATDSREIQFGVKILW